MRSHEDCLQQRRMSGFDADNAPQGLPAASAALTSGLSSSQRAPGTEIPSNKPLRSQKMHIVVQEIPLHVPSMFQDFPELRKESERPCQLDYPRGLSPEIWTETAIWNSLWDARRRWRIRPSRYIGSEFGHWRGEDRPGQACPSRGECLRRPCSASVMISVRPLSPFPVTSPVRVVRTQPAVLVILLALYDRLRPRRATAMLLYVCAHSQARSQPSLVCIFPTHNPSTALTSPVVLPYMSKKYIFHPCTGPEHRGVRVNDRAVGSHAVYGRDKHISSFGHGHGCHRSYSHHHKSCAPRYSVQ